MMLKEMCENKDTEAVRQTFMKSSRGFCTSELSCFSL